MLVKRDLVQLLGTIRCHPEFFIEPTFNHAFSTGLTAILCLFQMVLPIVGLRLLIRDFKRINTWLAVWLGREDKSITAVGRNSTLFFLPMLRLLAFQLFCCYTGC